MTAAAWVHDYAPPIRAMILAVPAFRVKLYVPFAIPFLRLRKTGYVLRSARVLGALGYSVEVVEPGHGVSVRGTQE